MNPPPGPRARATGRARRAFRPPGVATTRALRLPRPARTALVALSLACGGTAGADLEAIRAEIEDVTRRWERSLVAGDPAGAVTDVFTEDAMRLPAGEAPVRGRAAIAEALAGSVALSEARFDIDELEAEGGLAWARGTYAVRAPDGQVFSGKFLEVWRRTSAGWRIHRVMWD